MIPIQKRGRWGSTMRMWISTQVHSRWPSMHSTATASKWSLGTTRNPMDLRVPPLRIPRASSDIHTRTTEVSLFRILYPNIPTSTALKSIQSYRFPNSFTDSIWLAYLWVWRSWMTLPLNCWSSGPTFTLIPSTICLLPLRFTDYHWSNFRQQHHYSNYMTLGRCMATESRRFSSITVSMAASSRTDWPGISPSRLSWRKLGWGPSSLLGVPRTTRSRTSNR